jgi:hypothetical protein
MCHYTEILGSGDVLFLQVLTIGSIIASIWFWAWTYMQNGLEKGLWAYSPPIVFWTIFGTLDIVITAKGTFTDPLREGNPLARLLFVEIGFLGPVIASVLWISLWVGIVYVLNKWKVPHAGYFSLAIFWSLAAGHFFGFSSWFEPFCDFSENYRMFFADLPRMLKPILIGMTIAIFQYAGCRKIT